MTKTITLSTSVYAMIWANRQAGEETEDAILRRLLGCSNAREDTQEENAQEDEDVKDPLGENVDRCGGVYDSRNDVHFPEGFEVFRSYKHRKYKAIARNGFWVREDTGARFPSLNSLNASIVVGPENVWGGTWKYWERAGLCKSIDKLRRHRTDSGSTDRRRYAGF